MPAVFAYVADVTEPEGRSPAMGLLGAAIALGVSFGPLLGGVLGSVDLRLPYFTSAGLGLATAVAVLLVLPESLTPELQRRGGGAAGRAAQGRAHDATHRRRADAFSGLTAF